MATLDIVNFWECETAMTRYHQDFPSKSNPKKKYTVSLGTKGLECDCWPFRKTGDCQHVQQAESDRCGWLQLIDGGEPVKKGNDYFCPKCGAPSISRGWGV